MLTNILRGKTKYRLAAGRQKKPQWHTYFPQPPEGKRNIALAVRMFGLPLTVMRDILMGEPLHLAIAGSRAEAERRVTDLEQEIERERARFGQPSLLLTGRLRDLRQYIAERVDNPDPQLVGSTPVLAFTSNEKLLSNFKAALLRMEEPLKTLGMRSLLAEGGPILVNSHLDKGRLAAGSYYHTSVDTVRLPDVISLGDAAFEDDEALKGKYIADFANWSINYTLTHELGHRFMWREMTEEQYLKCGEVISENKKAWEDINSGFPQDASGARLGAVGKLRGQVKGAKFGSPTKYGQTSYSEAFAEWFVYHVVQATGRRLFRDDLIQEWRGIADPKLYKKLCAILGWKPANV